MEAEAEAAGAAQQLAARRSASWWLAGRGELQAAASAPASVPGAAVGEESY